MSEGRRKIFFLLFSMNMGGVEKSFLNFIASPLFNNAEIHLGLFRKSGEFLRRLPSNVIIHECCKGLWKEINMSYFAIIKKSILDKKPINFLKHSFGFIKYKITKNRTVFYKDLLGEKPEIEIEFDEAYAYAGPATVIDYYIIYKIKSRQKFGYIHFDVSKFFIEPETIKKLYKHYNKIFIVSKEAKNVFDKKFPEFKDKTELRINPIDINEIKKQSEKGESYSDKFEGNRILTVGRISKEKGQDLAIETLKILIEKGYNIRWYFIGDGPFLDECKDKAKAFGLDNYAIFLGKKENPYPFMKDCSVYVQPSRHEGFCLSVAEAKCFNKPIVSTDFSGSYEQLKETVNFSITAPSPQELAHGIIKVI
ncbi:MAG: glycosyltransferase [Erysipelotrichales bacterium]|nr:glycosyltransferase [Erysipelotrichales bacterium]